MSNVIVFMSDEHNPRYSSPYGHSNRRLISSVWVR